MPDNDESIIIRCPKCKVSTKYQLEVGKSFSFGMVTPSSAQSYSVSKIYFTRFFICPICGNNFKTHFALTVGGHEKINTVKVKGVIHEATDKQDRG